MGSRGRRQGAQAAEVPLSLSESDGSRGTKLQVIFRKRAINYRALLRKMSYDDKASYGSTPLCRR